MNVNVERLSQAQLLSEWERLSGLLAHKPQMAFWLLDQVAQQPADELRTESFIAVHADRWVGNVTLFHYRGIGLVGNVYLHPDCRGRGIGNKMMLAVQDFALQEKHKVHVLWVDPNKRPVAFEMYRKHGFIPCPNSGIMIKYYGWGDPYAESTELNLVPLAWRHFVQLNLITSLGNSDTLISFIHPCYGYATFESEFVKAMADSTEKCWALENKCGLAVGAVFFKKDPVWEQQREACYDNRNFLLDVIVESRHAPRLTKALNELPLPHGRVTTYTNVPGPKYDALSKIFTHRATLDNHFSWNGKQFDVAVLTKDVNHANSCTT